ncbi:hypothetical protein IE53DRAFT_388189 [Violaceomyces palustris]|uniref:Uncharacterized protein n=1 Tax=Violaceomyces palustris TaxID=1673888 RepID=A0ACD0NUQ4_9BASI|nr:hypothetical protein IE53DRAFT_388189 [Violaceomyces palustris]
MTANGPTSKKLPQAEVIQEWADYDSEGYSFERGRMEKNIQSICFEKPALLPPKPAGASKLKKEDVDFLVKDLLLTRPQAEASLNEAGGDLEKALESLVRAPSDW